jgi:O-antigen/teichoic acid export membrane protein
MTLESQPEVTDTGAAPSRIGKVALKAGAWILTGLGVMQVLRLLSNVVLTRLLFAEAFGMMQLVFAFMVGLHLFTDVGIGPSVVQSAHGDDPEFLDTAYTVQVIRGVLLCVVGVSLAYPFARYYGDSRLFPLLVGANFSTLLGGFQSTKWFTEGRKLALRRLTMLEVAIQFVSLVASLTVVYFTRSVYGLLAGSLLSDGLRAFASHYLLPGHRNRLRLVRRHLQGMLRFGRWIFISTLLTFLVGQTDRLIFGKLVPLAMLGVYGIAVGVAGMIPQVLNQIIDRLMFPMLSKVHNQENQLATAFVRARRPLLVLGGFGLAGFIGGGPAAVRLMYDPRYHGAGWIVQVLSLGAWFALVDFINTRALLARGDSHWLVASGLGKLGGMLLLIPIGYASFGFPGAVVGYATSELGRYLVSCIAVHRRGLSAFGDDAKFAALMLLASAMAFAASALVERHLTHNAAICSLAVFLAVLVVYAPTLRGLWRDLRELRAASAGEVASTLPPQPVTSVNA